MKSLTRKGFTLVELLAVMMVISILVAVIMPQLKGMQDESSLSKAEGDLKTIKTAIVSYWRQNNSTFPASLNHLTTASPQILPQLPTDAWNTGQYTGTPGSYGYLTGVDSKFGPWFLACTAGPHGTGGGGGGGGGMPSFDAANQRIRWPSSSADASRCVSNAPVYLTSGVPHPHVQ